MNLCWNNCICSGITNISNNSNTIKILESKSVSIFFLHISGFISTEMTAAVDPKAVEQWLQDIPMKRAGSTEDVANAALFLASDLSTYISGQVLPVCGAMMT